MKIAIRMDDITPDMDWERFLAFKEILDQHKIKPLIGVVPDNRDENLHKAKEASDFWEYVKLLQEEGWSIALHGYQHIYTTKKCGVFPLNDFSEFAGIPYSSQKSMLMKATQILNRNGIYTDIFMAPAHSYDKNTVKALLEIGYRKMTDGFGRHPYLWRGMIFYPISFKQSNTLKQKKGFSTLVIHANTLTDEDLKRYQIMFTEHADKMVSYCDILNETAKKRSIPGHVSEFIAAKMKHYLVKVKF